MADQHNLSAERLVVGGILIDQLYFWQECVEMDVEAFFNKDLKAVFQAIYNLAHSNRQITPTAVLSRIVELEAGEPAAFLSALQHEAQKAKKNAQLFVAEYASDIMLHHHRRKAKAWADKVAKEAEKPDFDPTAFFDTAMADASDMMRNTGSINERTIVQSGQETLLMLNEAAKEGGSVIHTGLKTLDDIIGGFIPGDFVLWGGAPGGAKQLCIHTKVPTPTGFTTMGEVNVGDEIFSEDGSITKVTAISPIKMAQRSYAVTFSTGETIYADGDHLWKTMTKKERAQALRLTDDYRERRMNNRASRAVECSKKPWTSTMLAERNKNMSHDYLQPPAGEVRDTHQLLATLKCGDHLNHSVDVAGALQTPDADLLIEPYLLGLWLGDGYSSKGIVGMMQEDLRECIQFVERDVLRENVLTESYSKPFSEMRFKDLQRDLKAVGVFGKKRIPMEYLRASVEQRKQLLRGLMDTDGTVDKDGKSSICFANKNLIEDAHQLISTLGIKSKVKKNISRQGHTSYRIHLLADFPLFNLKRKLERQKLAKGTRPTNKRRYITAIEPIEPRLMRCLAVAHKSRMYLVGDSCIATHNTALAMQMAMHMASTSHVAFFQLEMDHRQMMLRSIASATGISTREMLKGINDDRFASISDAVQGMAKKKLSIVANHRITITQIEAQLRAMKRIHGTRVVFVDHLGLIKRSDKYRMKDFEKDNINAEMLMEAASALDMTVICLSHFTKAGRQKESPDPEMEDFSGGGIEKHADFMFANLNRHDWLDRHPPLIPSGKAFEKWGMDKAKSEGKMEIFKLKDRRGPGRQKVILNWDGSRTLLSDVEPEYIPEELPI